MQFYRRQFPIGIVLVALGSVCFSGSLLAEDVLKIGVLGVMSGPAASWGLVNKYCAQTSAQLYNEQGGFEIGGKKYKIEIVAIDDKNDPKLAVSGCERLTKQEGIHFIIGPNVDTTAASVQPVAEASGAIYFPYAFQKSLYSPPHGNGADLIVLSGVAPADAPLLIKSARELGFKGILSTETAQDIKILNEAAGSAAEGFIFVGGASTPEIRSPEMENFVERYKKVAGEWNDEAGTKIYALEIILQTLRKAGPEAISNVELFKKAMDDFSMKNPSSGRISR